MASASVLFDPEKALEFYKKASDAGMAMGSSNVAKEYHFNDNEKLRDFAGVAGNVLEWYVRD